jgi:hypothetical protein
MADETAANPKPHEKATKGASQTLTTSVEPDPAPGRAAVGAVIGLYQLLQLIGEGGMGEVWLAEQKQPVRRRVAIKLIRPAWIRGRWLPVLSQSGRHLR